MPHDPRMTRKALRFSLPLTRRKAMALGTIGGAALAAPALANPLPQVNWRMPMFVPRTADAVVEAATDFTRRVSEATEGRFRIQPFGAGEIVPSGAALLDAAETGTVECAFTLSYYSIGKDPAYAFGSALPFGFNTRGQAAWLFRAGGLELLNAFFNARGTHALPVGNSTAQMGGFFRKEINSLDDLKGLKMRIPGLAGRVYQALGVDVRLLPAGEIFPALERGVIDAAEFVGPFLDRQLGLHRVAKNYYTTGWHETATVSELVINKRAWDSLPADLKAVVENACTACNGVSEAWAQKNNADALEDLVTNQGVIAKPLPDEVVAELRKVNDRILEEAVAKDAFVKKVHDSYMAYKAKYEKWTALSEGVYHSKVRGS